MIVEERLERREIAEREAFAVSAIDVIIGRCTEDAMDFIDGGKDGKVASETRDLDAKD